MALDDFWELVDNQRITGEAISNVYHCKRILAGADATNVGQAFIKTILEDELLAMQPSVLTRTTIDVRNLGDPFDFVSIDSSTLPGQRLGEIMPAFNASAIQFNRLRSDMRNGNKRWCAGGEGDQIDGVWTAGFQNELSDLGDAVVSSWEQVAAPGVDVCSFAVLKRFCVVPLQDPCLEYRLPNTDAEADGFNYVPVNFVVRSLVRSQVSRKKAN